MASTSSSNPSNQSVEPKKFKNVYQFRIILKHIKPNIWRRILVPENYNFKELHYAINSSMGWFNTHLHQFRIKNPVTGKQEIIGKKEDFGVAFFDDIYDVDEKTAKISDYFVAPNYKGVYEYDFGDGWDHEVIFQKIIAADANTKYPKCVAGKRACPPENCGGPMGYDQMMKIVSDPSHPDYEDYRDNLAINTGVEPDEYDPDKFDPNAVDFEGPFGTLY